jgi:hypothetical protein
MHARAAIRKITMIFGFIICAQSLHAQLDENIPIEKSNLPKSYPIHASDLLWKQELEVRNYIKHHPDAMKPSTLHKAAAWNFNVGSTYTWYADDLRYAGVRYRVPSTCRAMGTNCYIFVEDANWGTQGAKVTQAMVDSIQIYFDSKTPANPSKGIFETDTSAFGNPPDVDDDPRIVILLLDIVDGYSGTGGYVAGYFYSFNEINPSEPGYGTSNFTEMFYIDVNPTNLNTKNGLNDALSTLAHEFQHMIHFNYDKYELKFVNEGCSTLAEVNCGFPIYSPSLYAGEPNHFLWDWRENSDPGVLNDYSRAARFFVYLRDQMGMRLFKPLVASTNTGEAGINAGLQSIGAGVYFSDILKNWFVANILDDRTVDSKYGYLYQNLPKPIAKTHYNPNVALITDTVNNYAVRYISFKKASQLKATFTVSNPEVIIKAVEIGPSSKRVQDVISGAEFSEPFFGSTYTEVDFVVMNTDPHTPNAFSYQASGTNQVLELKYDYTEPIAANLTLMSDGDTVCVVFDAVQDGQLDSIRVALRRNTPITGGVWKYTGFINPSPLGQPLATNLTVSGSKTPTTYPDHWDNWGTIDLRSKNISTNSSFAVGFRVDGTYPDDQTINRVMITTGPVTSTPTSLTYIQNTTVPNWYYINSGTDSMFYYLIRAYVSFPETGVRKTIELSPLTFNLGQNYPNPFNPSTKIQFELPSRSFVTLKVYDMIGREVATLVNGIKEAGSHEIKFDASSLPSGIYLYRIATDKFVETKKLALIK